MKSVSVHPLNVVAPVVASAGSLIASEHLTAVPFVPRVLMLGALSGLLMYAALKYVAHESAKHDGKYRTTPRIALASWAMGAIALGVMLLSDRLAAFAH